MNRLMTMLGTVATCWTMGAAMADQPIYLDAPTPPPCAADGTCYPNTGEWGYYPSRWRPWPGDQLEPTPAAAEPTPAEERISPELGPTETPPPELEDATPPPSSPKREIKSAPPESDEAPPTSEGTTLPDVPLPDDETPPASPLTEPTGDADPPPTLPFAVSAPGRAPSGVDPAPPAAPRRSAARVSAGDPPPTPPWAFRSASL
jgi:hypothetical protein